ncbi:hypothetical protein [Thaumasiovibrio sp. DFM-14]|uniref:hypothetical protein n=1 Tax=Thaumasiovibrio sp. DFM-14 TaxID=3384792 RepID=UPI0039A3CB2D
MKRNLLWLICLLSMFGCVDEQYTITSNAIGGLQVIEQNVDGGLSLRVSGLIMDSGQAMVDHQITLEDERLMINIDVAGADKDKRPSFSLLVSVPNDISQVLIGRDNALIWQRD